MIRNFTQFTPYSFLTYVNIVFCPESILLYKSSIYPQGRELYRVSILENGNFRILPSIGMLVYSINIYVIHNIKP